MESVRLNGRPLAAVVVSVNPVLDRDATKTYLDLRKDGLDSIGVETQGQHRVIIGRGLPERVGAEDRLEISNHAARILYQENEVNSFTEGFSDRAQSSEGAAYLLGGMAIGAGGAYLATVFGFLTLPAALSMLLVGVGTALLAVLILGAIGGYQANRRDYDPKVSERLQDPSIEGTPDKVTFRTFGSNAIHQQEA